MDVKDAWVWRSALLFFNRLATHLNTMHLCLVGGVRFAAGLFQTSCYYIPLTNQPHFDAACLASLRALEAFSPNKELNAPNTHMLPKIQCLPKLALELGSELMALDLQWSAAKYINCICKTWVASYPA